MPEEQKSGVIDVSELDPNFKHEIAKEPGGEKIKACFACGTCSASCPVREIDETYNPRKIIRMAILGMRDRVLKSDFIWLCSTCYTCEERCPHFMRWRSLTTREGRRWVFLRCRLLLTRSGPLLSQWD